MVNQLLTHISNTPLDLIEFCKNNGILVEAYSPIAHGEALKNEKIIAMASKFKIWCKCFTTLDPIYNRVRTSFSTTSIY